MKSNKIVHIFSHLKAGEETIAYELIAYLARYQYKQAVICFQNNSQVDRIRSIGVPVHCIKGFLFHYDFVFWIRLILLMRKLKPWCINSSVGSHSLIARIIASMIKTKLIVSISKPPDYRGIISSLIDCYTINSASIIIARTQDVAASIMKDNKWISAQKIKIIENGIDPQALKLSTLHFRKTRYDLELSDEHIIIGSIGDFTPHMRFEILIDSFVLINTQYPLTRLVLIGSGPEEGALKKQMIRFGLEQDVLFIDDPLIHGYYSLFDLFILPSDHEGVSFTLLETLSFGLPTIIGTNHLHHPVVIHGRNGYMVAPKARMIAQAVQEIIENEPLKLRISKQAKITVDESFSLEKTLASYRQIFSDLAEKAK